MFWRRISVHAIVRMKRQQTPHSVHIYISMLLVSQCDCGSAIKRTKQKQKRRKGKRKRVTRKTRSYVQRVMLNGTFKLSFPLCVILVLAMRFCFFILAVFFAHVSYYFTAAYCALFSPSTFYFTLFSLCARALVGLHTAFCVTN